MESFFLARLARKKLVRRTSCAPEVAPLQLRGQSFGSCVELGRKELERTSAEEQTGHVLGPETGSGGGETREVRGATKRVKRRAKSGHKDGKKWTQRGQKLAKKRAKSVEKVALRCGSPFGECFLYWSARCVWPQ